MVQDMKERLIKLLEEANNLHSEKVHNRIMEVMHEKHNNNSEKDSICSWAEDIADYLISKGVKLT